MTLTIIGRLFSLGEVAITANAFDALSVGDINSGLTRHLIGDWGDISEADRGLNDVALRHDQRLLSVYHTKKNVRYWIITEWDRSQTTILLPSDY